MFNKMLKPDSAAGSNTVIFNNLLDGLCKVGRTCEGLALLNRMKIQRCNPNPITFNALIDGFCKAGDIDTTHKLNSQMVKEGAPPNLVMLNTLIFGICRNGMASGALSSFHEKKMAWANAKGNSITYCTLIRAFLHVNNVELGERIAGYLFKASYCHSMQVCHRDLKLENTLLDGSAAPRLKICDFGYSKSAVLHSQPKSTVGTPAYIAPEILLKKEYDGKIADVWSCGVTLFVMLVGAYPFEDPEEPKNYLKTIQRILGVQYSIPDNVPISPECRHLISRIFVADPAMRITIPEIYNHEWFLKNLPIDLTDDSAMSTQYQEPDQPMQNIDVIMQIIAEATIPAAGTHALNPPLYDGFDLDDMEDFESDPELDVDSSGEIIYAM